MLLVVIAVVALGACASKTVSTEKPVLRKIARPEPQKPEYLEQPARYADRAPCGPVNDFEDALADPPALGRDTAAVLSGVLSYDAERIEALTRDKVIQ